VNGDDVAFLPAVEQAELVRRREISSVELAETYLDRIERIDGELNAYVALASEQALAVAVAADEKPSERAFRGIPMSVKDLTETAGIPTTFSSRAFAAHIPAADVAVVRRLRQAGFVLLGKTNTPEFGTLPVTESTLNGSCRSPWDVSRTAGGSSGGAAASVAAGLCPIAHGSDGGGSCRIPASCCGVVGLKPARGRVSHAPYAGLEGLSTHAIVARTILDAAALLDVMAGYETGDPYWAPPPARPFRGDLSAPARLRVAVAVTPPIEVPVDDGCASAAREAGELLSELGHSVEEATPAWWAPELLPLFIRVWQVGPALYGVRDLSLLDPINRALAEAALATSSVDFALAALRLTELARRVVAFFDEYDVLVTPTLALPPVPAGWITHDDGDIDRQFQRAAEFTPFTAVVNLTGQPAVSLPLAWRDGLPLGVQLVGRPADEATLLRLAAQIEEARPWANRRPPLS
jgi:amidase